MRDNSSFIDKRASWNQFETFLVNVKIQHNGYQKYSNILYVEIY